MKQVFIMLLLAVSSYGNAQINYAVSAIPDSLKKDASKVFRLDEAMLEVVSPTKYKFTVHQIVTLLNENAAYKLAHQLWMDKFVKYDNIKITVYNQEGKSVKSYGRKDFTVEAPYDGITLVSDDKVMHLYTPPPGYPCTVEINYEQTFNSYIELPDWSFAGANTSVEISKYTVQVPADLDIRYRTLGALAPPVITNNGPTKQYYWELRNYTAKASEPGTFGDYNQFPSVEVSPNQFSYDGYPGSFRSWSDFGAWNYALYESAQPFDEARKTQINNLLQGATTEKEKVARLYKYMQQNMRYVSIQLGIGGFKPFAVGFVDSKKYGDCKALTNYMRNLLKVANIHSYPALVNAGNELAPVSPTFPASEFNHVILCAFADGDTTWLECTSNTNEVGKLGDFTENRYALLLTEQGGKLINTPKSKAADNRFTVTTQIILNEDGNGSSDTRFALTGEYIQEFLNYVGEEKKDDQKKYLMMGLGFIQPDEFDISFDKQVPVANAELKMVLEKIPSFTAGSKMFLSPRIYKLWSSELPPTTKRINDFYLGTPFIKTDTTVYQLPEGFGIENLPQPKKIQTEYGSFISTYTWDAAKRTITSTAQLEVKERVVPAVKYAATKEFFDKVIAEFNEKMVVKKL